MVPPPWGWVWLVSAHCEWAVHLASCLLNMFNMPSRERNSWVAQVTEVTVEWGVGQGTGLALPGRPVIPATTGELEGATTCGFTSVGSGLSEREALSFLPFFSKQI